MKRRGFYLIVCEGDSEVAYVQELARLARENEWDVVFKAKLSEGGGELSALTKACKGTDRESTRVMVDWDRFERNERKCREKYADIRERLPKFLFQYHNFEDFLLMHFPAEVGAAWRTYAARHFERPLTADDYVPLLKAFAEEHKEALGWFLDYEKGSAFPLTQAHLDNLFQNNTKDGLPRSDFARFLQTLLSDGASKQGVGL